MKIENGVHDISNEIYHSSEGISRSALVEFKRSPYHYWYKYLNTDKEPVKSTPAMKLGELVHALVLEPKEFDKRYIVEPELLPLPKVGLLKDLGREEFDHQKAVREEVAKANQLITDRFAKDSKGKEAIKIDIFKEAKAYADAVLKNDMAQALFNNIKAEHSIYFTHKQTGLQCKVRPDAWLGSIVTDLKTCADASYKAFQSAAFRSGYFLQAAMTKQALKSIGITLERFIFFCVEKSDGMPCVYYPVDGESLENAENEFNNLMYNLAHCLEKNNWQSYEPQTLTYPLWA